MKLPKRKLFRVLLYIVGGLIILLVVGLSILRLMLPGIIKKQVEKISTETLGTKTTLGSVELSLMGGNVALKDLKLEQPDGLKGDPFLTLDKLEANVNIASLLGSTIVVNSVQLDKVNLNLITASDGNRTLQAVLAKVSGKPETTEETPLPPEEQPSEAKPEEKSSTGIFIKSIVISPAQFKAHDELAGASPVDSTIAFDKLTIQNYRITDKPAEYKSEYVSLTLEDLTVTLADLYSDPQLASLGTLNCAMDLNRLNIDPANPAIYVDNLEILNTQIKGEYVEKYNHEDSPDNIEDFSIVWTNATSTEPPVKFPAREIASDQPKEDDSLKTAALDSAKDIASGITSEVTGLTKDTAGLAINTLQGAGESLTTLIQEEEKEKTSASDEPKSNVSVEVRNSLISEFTYQVKAPKGKRLPLSLDEFYSKIDNFSYPYVSGKSSNVDVRMKSNALDFSAEIKGSGALTEDQMTQDRTVTMKVKNLPLWLLKDIRDGSMSTDLDASIHEGVMSGTVTLAANDLRPGSDANSFTKYSLRTVDVLSKFGIGKTPVKFHVPVQGASPQQLILLLLQSMAETSTSAITTTGARGTEVLMDSAAKGTEVLKDSATKGTDIIKDSATGLLDTLQDTINGDDKDKKNK